MCSWLSLGPHHHADAMGHSATTFERIASSRVPVSQRSKSNGCPPDHSPTHDGLTTLNRRVMIQPKMELKDQKKTSWLTRIWSPWRRGSCYHSCKTLQVECARVFWALMCLWLILEVVLSISCRNHSTASKMCNLCCLAVADEWWIFWRYSCRLLP